MIMISKALKGAELVYIEWRRPFKVGNTTRGWQSRQIMMALNDRSTAVSPPPFVALSPDAAHFKVE